MGDRDCVDRAVRCRGGRILGQVRSGPVRDTGGIVLRRGRLHAGGAVPARARLVRADARDGAGLELLDGDAGVGVFSGGQIRTGQGYGVRHSHGDLRPRRGGSADGDGGNWPGDHPVADLRDGSVTGYDHGMVEQRWAFALDMHPPAGGLARDGASEGDRVGHAIVFAPA